MRNALPPSVALLVVWAGLAWYQPATTWHLAPALAVAAGPVLLRVRQGRAPWSVAAGAVGATAAAALVTTAALARADLLQGPAIVGGSAAAEAVIVILAAGLWATWTAGRTGPAIIVRILEDAPDIRSEANGAVPMSSPADDTTATADRVLDRYRTFAVVGASPDPDRPSHGVMGVLQRNGYTVFPVNPHATEVRGRTCYPDVASIPEPVEVVDIFRRADAAGAHVDEAIAIGAKAVWMQLGVIDEAAAQRAREAGLEVVMDRCPAIELARRASDRTSA